MFLHDVGQDLKIKHPKNESIIITNKVLLSSSGNGLQVPKKGGTTASECQKALRTISAAFPGVTIVSVALGKSLHLFGLEQVRGWHPGLKFLFWMSPYIQSFIQRMRINHLRDLTVWGVGGGGRTAVIFSVLSKVWSAGQIGHVGHVKALRCGHHTHRGG